jgi:hypothetical protein
MEKTFVKRITIQTFKNQRLKSTEKKKKILLSIQKTNAYFIDGGSIT